MKKYLSACISCLLVLAFVSVSGKAYSETQPDEQKLLTEHTYNILNAVHENMNKEEYSAALEKINALLSEENLSSFDKAVILQTKGYVLNTLDKHKEAAQAFIGALDENILPDDVAHQLYYLTAQLLIFTESYKEGLSYLETWFKNESRPDAEAHMLAASAYYQTGAFREMIPHVKTAIDRTERPMQSWYEILLAGYYEISDFRNAADVLETMIASYPDNNNYWLQLAGMYQRLKQEEKALAVSELAYIKGGLDNTEILQLAKSYLYMQMPYRAAKLLEDEINAGTLEKNSEILELLGNSWLLSRETENALNVLSEAAEKSSDATIYFRIGQLSVEMERWTQAVVSLESALRLGLVNNKDNAYLLLGIAAFHINDRLRSIRAFNIALSSDSISEKAKWWWEYLYRSHDS